MNPNISFYRIQLNNELKMDGSFHVVIYVSKEPYQWMEVLKITDRNGEIVYESKLPCLELIEMGINRIEQAIKDSENGNT